MRLGGSLGWVLLVVAAMALLASLLSVPVWLQNRYQNLMREQVGLERDQRSLEARYLQLRMEIGKLSSMGRIVEIAYGMGLVFRNMPVKVMEIPRSNQDKGVP